MRYFFDITTSARWTGHAVGIVRVERELALRAPGLLPGDVGYCVYLPDENAYRRLDRPTAEAVLTSRLELDFDPPPPAPAPASRLQTLRRSVRGRIMDSPRLYQSFQRLRGRRFTIEDIIRIREEERALAAGLAPRRLPVRQAAPERLVLSPEVTIISGGLDWEHKRLRNIYRLKEEHGFRYVAVVYDLIPLIYPHFVVPGYVALLTEYFGELLWVADGCLCISQTTLADLRAHCEREGVPAPAAAHFPLGSDLPRADGDEAELPDALQRKRFALFVSTIEPRKNHRLLYQAWDHCVRRGLVDPDCDRLAFVGREGWSIGDLLHEMGANPATNRTIVRLGSVDDRQLALMYRSAAFTLFPSFYEGYGLPVAEALGYGRVCVASGRGSIPEVAGDLIVYRDPIDVLGWAEEIARLFARPDDVAMLEARIAHEYRPVTWDDAARAFFDRLPAVAGR